MREYRLGLGREFRGDNLGGKGVLCHFLPFPFHIVAKRVQRAEQGILRLAASELVDSFLFGLFTKVELRLLGRGS